MHKNLNVLNPRFTLLIILLTSLALGCKKDPAPIKPESEGIFNASIDNEFWQPIWYNATYYSKSKMLYLAATDRGIELTIGINIDANPILKQYSLEPNGTNAARLMNSYYTYISDHNISDAGGNFILTKFDTVGGKLSGKIDFRAYSFDGSKHISFGNSKIENIKLTVDDTTNIEGYVNVTVEGVKSTNWFTNNLYPAITCISNGVHQALEVRIISAVGATTLSRGLTMQIPLDLGTGSFQVKPAVPPYTYCGRTDITARYTMGDLNANYYPISGNFNITSIDTVARNLKANFDFTVRDSVSNKVVHFANGQVQLNNWYKMR